MLNLTSKTGKKQSVSEWVGDMMPEDRAALCKALAPYAGAAFDGQVSLEKFQKDFSNLSSKDRVTFMTSIQHGISIAQAAFTEEAIDRALQAELTRRNAAAGVQVKQNVGEGL